MKVIFIISFPPNYKLIKDENDLTGTIHHWHNEKGEILGVYDKNWGAVIGDRLMRINPEITFEVWRPDFRAKKKYVFKNSSGPNHVLFPCKAIKSRFGAKMVSDLHSPEMIEDIRKLLITEEKPLFILPIARKYLVKEIINHFHDKFPFIYPHLTHNASLLPKATPSFNLFKYIHRYMLKKQHERILQKMNYITVAHLKFREKIGKKYNAVVEFYSPGFDKQEWKTNYTREQVRKEFNIPEDRKVLLSCSRLVPEKQIDKFIIALSKFADHDFHWYIVGHGDKEYEKYLKEVIKDNKLEDKITFTGFLTYDILQKYYLLSDLFIMSSISEAGPVSAFEAVWFGVPVFSTNTGALAEYLEEKDKCVVVNRRDYSAWIKTMSEYFNGKNITKLSQMDFLDRFDAFENIKRLNTTIKEVYINYNKKR